MGSTCVTSVTAAVEENIVSANGCTRYNEDVERKLESSSKLAEAESVSQLVCALEQEDILHEIFQHLDMYSLLKCRLVCSIWNFAIINAPELMRRIEVGIDDTVQFLESSIASKARHFRFQNDMFLGATDQLDEFVDGISSTAEAVTFHTWNRERQHFMNVRVFLRVISKCGNLKHLSVISPPQVLLECLSEELVSKCVITKLERLKLDCWELWKSETLRNLRLLILKLPKLRSVKFSKEHLPMACRSTPDMRVFLDMFLEHMKLHPDSLKKLSFRSLISIEWTDYYDTKLWEFLLTAAKQKIKFKSKDRLPLDQFAFFVDSLKQATLTEENCRLIRLGKFAIGDNLFDTQDGTGILRACTNLTDLHLKFNRCPSFGDLTFLELLDKLEKLSLLPGSLIEGHELVGIHVFPSDLPSIRFLHIEVPMFEDTAFRSFYIVFPNLNELVLYRLENLPDDVICALAKMDNLAELKFTRCNLSDAMLLRPFEVQMTRDDDTRNECSLSSVFAPSIIAFKCLKALHSMYCLQLTDLCLVQGVARSRTIELVVLFTGGNQFSSEALNEVIESGKNVFKDGRQIEIFLP